MTWVDAALPAWARAHVHKLDTQMALALAQGWPGGPLLRPHLMLEIVATAFHDFDQLLATHAAHVDRVTEIPTPDDSERRFYTAQLAEAFVAVLVAQDWVVQIAWGESERLPRVPDRSLRGKRASVQAAPIPLSNRVDSEVLIGIIDHGCPFAHRGYRRGAAGGTRVHAIWDQDALPDFPTALGFPQGFGYGRIATNADLDGWMAASTRAGRFDEAACYRHAEYGAVDTALTHGSHTLGVLAGASWSPSLEQPPGGGFRRVGDKAATADIVFVQLPRIILEAPSLGGDHRCILDGLRFIVDCAGDKVRRIVVVVDYGSNLGPHDASSLFERAVAALVDEVEDRGKQLDIVFPAGNSFADRVHAVVGPLAAHETAGLQWRVDAGSETRTDAEIWVSVHSRCTVTVTPPRAAPFVLDLTTVPVAMPVAAWPDAARPQFLVATRTAPNGQTVLALRCAATDATQAGVPVAPAGRWDIAFEAGASATTRPVNVYVCWGGHNIGFPRRTSQSQLLRVSDPLKVVVDGMGTVLGSACGRNIHVIGGFRGSVSVQRIRRAAYSARGPKRGATAGLPDFLALSDESAALPGVLGYGTGSAVTARVWGTSVAAPQAARELAEHGGLANQLAGPLPPEFDGGLLRYRPV